MELRTVGSIIKTLLPPFEKYRSGIEALLKIPTEGIYVIQDENAGTIRIALSQGRSLPLPLVTFSKNLQDHLDIDLLGDPNTSVEIIIAVLHNRINEATVTARTTVRIGVDQSKIYKMLDWIDFYNEAIRILNSR